MMNLKPTTLFAGISSLLILLAVGFVPEISAEDTPGGDPPNPEPGPGDGAAKPDPGGAVSLGPLISCSHGVNGTVKVLSKYAVEVTLTGYDGKGANAWFHATKKGTGHINARVGAQTLMKEKHTCPESQFHKDKPIVGEQHFVVVLPLPISDYESIGIFDYAECKSFAHVKINGSAVEHVPDGDLKSDSCKNITIPSTCSALDFPLGKCGEGIPNNASGRSAEGGNGSETAGNHAPSFAPTWTFAFGILAAFGLHLCHKK